ncbi:MAG: hypothetical protein DRN12_02810 [Thermoplasmata archaeon]|nr:MAG: hypothetical protein DRN12_02810 [Thermoplasmata archaeon]
MVYVIFEVPSEQQSKINDLIKDDVISRQSILTRDARALNIDKDVSYVKIEGNEEAIKKAEELAEELEFKKLDEKEASEINDKIREQEDSAADGMGMIFG